MADLISFVKLKLAHVESTNLHCLLKSSLLQRKNIKSYPPDVWNLSLCVSRQCIIFLHFLPLLVFCRVKEVCVVILIYCFGVFLFSFRATVSSEVFKPKKKKLFHEQTPRLRKFNLSLSANREENGWSNKI